MSPRFSVVPPALAKKDALIQETTSSVFYDSNPSRLPNSSLFKEPYLTSLPKTVGLLDHMFSRISSSYRVVRKEDPMPCRGAEHACGRAVGSLASSRTE